MNQKVVKSKASTVVASLADVARSGESGQGETKREFDTPYAIGKFDHNGHEIEEKYTDSGGY